MMLLPEIKKALEGRDVKIYKHRCEFGRIEPKLAFFISAFY